MAKRVSKEVPIAERIIEFGKDDFCENMSPFDFPESVVTEKMLEEFAEKALVLVDGTDILQYPNEYPIVVYQGKESPYIMPEPRLNSFVLNIVVSTGVDGKRYSIGSGKMEE